MTDKKKKLRERAQGILRQYATGPVDCLFCGVIHTAGCPKEDMLIDTIVAVAASIQEADRQQIASLEAQRDDMFDWRTKTAERCEALEQQLAEARALIEQAKKTVNAVGHKRPRP